MVVSQCINEAEELRYTGSYFWDRLSENEKDHWKELKKTVNEDRGYTGKRKKTAFWLFAKNLQSHLKNNSKSNYYTLYLIRDNILKPI